MTTPVAGQAGILPPTSLLPSIPELFDRIADANPSYPAIATLLRTDLGLDGSYLEETSFGELQAMSRRAAYFLTAPEFGINLKKGSTVALWVSNRADAWMASFLACARIGALVLNLNPRFREAEMTHFLKTADADLVILENGLLGVDYVRMTMEVAPNGGKKLAIVNMGSAKDLPAADTISKWPRPIVTVPARWEFENCPLPIPELPQNCRGDVNSPVVCFTTSGTTGPSKLATHKQAGVVRVAVDLSWCWDMRPAKGTVMFGQLKYGKYLEYGGRKESMELDTHPATLESRIRDVLLGTVPYCGAFGFHIVFAMLIGAGGTVLMLDGYHPDVAAYWAHNYCALAITDPPPEIRGATHFLCPDAVHADLIARAGLYGVAKSGKEVPWKDRAYTRNRWSHMSNFANKAKEMVPACLDMRPHAFTIEAYGMSETLACMAAWNRYPLLEKTSDGYKQIAQPDPKYVGRAGGILFLPEEMDVKIIDPDTGNDLPLGIDHPGELCFRGPQIHMGYLNNPEATRKSLIPANPEDPDQRAWFKSGDFGHMPGPKKEDGFVFLNRLGDSLRLRGFLTNPGEIEDLIKLHPSILEAQVVGCPPSITIGGKIQEQSTTGDVAVAFIILREEYKHLSHEVIKREVVKECRAKLANYKVPAEVFVVEEYPVTVAANGTKVQKHRLREMARERGVTLSRGQGVSGAKEARL